jgi:UDP-N-acetylmuramyl pentapeptide phosphotransferase/UDP-N-acetylglucosamine-1-phosphate transferase
MMSNAEIVVVILAAAAIGAAIILALLPTLTRHASAHPNARSSHAKATPQGGGIAVIGATIAVATGALAYGSHEFAPYLTTLCFVFGATIFIALVGLVDDIRPIEVIPRLLLQALAVGVMLAALPAELRVVPALPWWIERALLLTACVWFVNLTNFMDGIDWMTVAEAVPITVGLTVVGLLGGLPMHAVIVALALCGGLIGFAPFNRPIARIFLGDVGSLSIGLLLAWLLVLLACNGYVTAALVLPLYYLADTTITLLRRTANREPFWRAHRTHFYQRATDRGFSVSDIVQRVFATNLALTALACASVLWPGPLSTAAALIGGAALVGWLLWSFARGKS